MKNSIKREKSQACLSYSERENVRATLKATRQKFNFILTLALWLTMVQTAWAEKQMTDPGITATVPNQTMSAYSTVYGDRTYVYIYYKFEEANSPASYGVSVGETVKDGETTLTLGTDYVFGDVYYSDMTGRNEPANVGDECLVEIKGINAYEGTLYVPFTIISPPASGTYGGLTWSLANGTLSITGTGAMTAAATSAYPWCNYCSSITTICIGEGVTSIADNAFGSIPNINTYSNVSKVFILSTVTSIGADAFKGCIGATDVYCYANPANLTWGDTNDDFKSDGSTKCHVANAPVWSGFTNVHVTFEGNLADVSIPIPYIDADGNTTYCTDYTVLTGSDKAVSLSAGWYVVNSDISYTGTITLTGDVNIILGDGKTMTVNTTGNSIDGKDYTNPGDLTIYGQTVQGGTLSVTASGEISEGICCQNFTVNSGAVNATGVYYGINAENGAITINNGYVNATSSYIGYGSSCISASLGITISGGTVEAYSKNDGISSYIGDIIISGGNVTVECTDYSSTRGIYNDSGNITISDGTVEVTSENLGIYADSGGITISGGSVKATGKGEGSGIDSYNPITISSGNVTATGGEKGIFSSYGITINGGSVTATGDEYGLYSANDNIEINGGIVEANGGQEGILAQDGYFFLNWTSASDRIKASSYKGNADEGTCIINGKAFTDGQGNFYSGILSDADRVAIVGKTLTPGMTLTAKAVTEGDVTNYWTTFYYGDAGFSFDATENACAYTATVSGGTITLHKLGRVIPKNTAVIIVGTDESINMTVSEATAENTVDNHLHGVDVATAQTSVLSTYSADAILMLSNKGGNFGFHELATTMTNVPARKAFLAINDPSGAREFTMMFDDATGIVDNKREPITNNQWYTLDGRRLTGKPTQKGLYIHNGTKVLVK